MVFMRKASMDDAYQTTSVSSYAEASFACDSLEILDTALAAVSLLILGKIVFENAAILAILGALLLTFRNGLSVYRFPRRKSRV